MNEERAPEPILPDSWTTKEVIADLKQDLVGHLNKQDVTLGEISSKVDSKADKADLVAIALKIDGHGERITSLENHRLESIASRQFRNKVWAVVGTVCGILAILAGSLIAAFVH